ncbi:uncharacterized protein [Prorops nasuta]|uniref:uncharacterized protein n=1 Tax=Prorops nasuta TaxID=863751 RepID=UPI0034CF458F
MKFFAYCLVLLFALIQLSEQKASFVNCTPRFQENHPHTDTCIKVICDSESSFSAVACPLAHCQPGKELGATPEDLTKVYPECCSRPICAD